MPYARVGVIPQPDRQSKSNRSQRKQGITMGDLKKQTALRLAQEQQQTRFSPNFAPPPKEDVAVLDHVAYTPHGNYQDSRQQMVPPSQAVSMPLQPGVVYPRPAPSVPAAMYGSENTQRQLLQSGHNSKLPHGLTVQELKEMTKARLQAEMTEQQNQDMQSRAPPGHVYQPNQHYQQVRRDARSSPFLEHQRGHNRSYGHDRILSPTPPSGPPGFQGVSSPNYRGVSSPISMSQPLDGQSSWQHTSREAWETGSVDTHNSTINSDYLGSESAYNLDDFGEIPFSRSRSYPAAPPERQFDAQSTGNSFFEHLTPNRRRAVTMSPRTLSHLDETRPSCVGFTELSIPFDMPGENPRNGISLQPTGGREPPGFSDFSNRSRTYSGSGVIGDGSFTFNRPRTSSAPTISSFVTRTGEMFGEDSRVSSGQAITTNDLPSAMVESLLGESSHTSNRDTSDLSSVFRMPSQDGGGGYNPWGGSTLGGLQGVAARTPQSIDSDAALARDLGSVLSLSSPEESGLTPRMDPEVSLFSSFGGRNGDFADEQLHGIYGNQSSFDAGDLGCRDQGY